MYGPFPRDTTQTLLLFQMSNKTTGGRDKSKLLMERLRMLEKENSSLVLENEQQRQQYEKCLDEIANQVCRISDVVYQIYSTIRRGFPSLE